MVYLPQQNQPMTVAVFFFKGNETEIIHLSFTLTIIKGRKNYLANMLIYSLEKNNANLDFVLL